MSYSLQIWTSARRRSHHTAWPFVAASTQGGSTLLPSLSSTQDSATAEPIDGGPLIDAPVITISPTETEPRPFVIPAYAPRDDEPDQPIKSGTPVPPRDALPGTTNAGTGIRVKVVEKAQMGEINPGVWDGLNPDQARKYYPDEWERFARDPYAYRAPRAESYHDLCVRLEPILVELEREQEDLLIISHASVIRCLLAYLIGLPGPQVPAVEVARGDLIEVVPTSYGVRCQTYHFWDGPGRRDPKGSAATPGEKDETNFYENYAEDTKGKKVNVDGAKPE
jgi:6-phosphofructo-2-kinase/fructose-2,6-biphosphatase 4